MAERESLRLWDTTAANNGAADPSVGWAEGQLPSTVNNSARGMMAAEARNFKDNNGSLTTAGSANAYTLTINNTWTAYANGQRLSFKASFANTGAATLNVTNADATALGAKAIRAPGDVALSAGQIISGGRYDVQYDTTANSAAGAWTLLNPNFTGPGIAPREVLSANRTYYVRTDGSDSNTGLVNSAGGGFLTIQKAINVVRDTLDLNGFNVLISVAAGTYTGVVVVTGRWTGEGVVTLQGDTSTPTNVYINVTGRCLSLTRANLTVAGFKFKATINCIDILYYSRLDISNCYFDATPGVHLNTGYYSYTSCTGPFTINGSSGICVHCTNQGYFLADGSTWTLSGSAAFSAFFFGTSENSVSLWSVVFSGSATGVRSFIHQGSVVETVGSGSNPDNYFPGNAASTFQGDGSYNDSLPMFAPKAWVNLNGTGTIAILASYGVSSITDLGTGDYRVTYGTAFASIAYAVFGTCSSGVSAVTNLTTTTSEIFTFNVAGAAADAQTTCVMATGQQA